MSVRHVGGANNSHSCSGADPAAVAGGLGEIGSLASVSRADISQAQGRAFASLVFELDEGEWQGPLRSRQGVGYFRVQGRTPARERGLDEVDYVVRQDWIASHHRASLDEAMEDVRPRYRVELAGDGVAP